MLNTVNRTESGRVDSQTKLINGQTVSRDGTRMPDARCNDTTESKIPLQCSEEHTTTIEPSGATSKESNFCIAQSGGTCRN